MFYFCNQKKVIQLLNIIHKRWPNKTKYSACIHVCEHTHTRKHTYLPECRPLCFAASALTALTELISFQSCGIYGTGKTFGQFSACIPQPHEAMKTLLTTWWREICSALGKTDIWGIFFRSRPDSSQVFRILLA